jgi:hypothetical protein
MSAFDPKRTSIGRSPFLQAGSRRYDISVPWGGRNETTDSLLLLGGGAAWCKSDFKIGRGDAVTVQSNKFTGSTVAWHGGKLD